MFFFGDLFRFHNVFDYLFRFHAIMERLAQEQARELEARMEGEVKRLEDRLHQRGGQLELLVNQTSAQLQEQIRKVREHFVWIRICVERFCEYELELRRVVLVFNCHTFWNNQVFWVASSWPPSIQNVFKFKPSTLVYSQMSN